MLKPEISIPAGLATVAVVYSIYSRGMAPNLDLRMTEPGEPNADSVRRQNAIMAAGVVAGVSLIAKDPNIFIMGGIALVALDWTTRHAIWANPFSGKVEVDRAEQMHPTQAMDDAAYGGPDLVAV